MSNDVEQRKAPSAVYAVRVAAVALALAGIAICTLTADAAQVVYPIKDGTLADGGIYGPFDGVADDWDWIFNDSSYDGALTREIKTAPANSLEHRVVWEYSLSTVTLAPPTLATLTATVRGAPVFPRPNAVVHVYAYPADLQETPADFNSGPIVFVGSVTVPPFQTREATFNVSSLVNEARLSGANRVAFRFQIDPDTASDVSQAFIDALDSDPTSKPYIVIEAAAPGDFNFDRDVDQGDFGVFQACFSGAEVDHAPGCESADFDHDGDADQADFGVFQACFSGAGVPADPNCGG